MTQKKKTSIDFSTIRKKSIKVPKWQKQNILNEDINGNIQNNERKTNALHKSELLNYRLLTLVVFQSIKKIMYVKHRTLCLRHQAIIYVQFKNNLHFENCIVFAKKKMIKLTIYSLKTILHIVNFWKIFILCIYN